MPIGMPGCPEFAFCTASIDRARSAFARSLWLAVAVVWDLAACADDIVHMLLINALAECNITGIRATAQNPVAHTKFFLILLDISEFF
jgi:hypothetical protein